MEHPPPPRIVTQRDKNNAVTDPWPLRADHLHNASRDTCGFETEATLSPSIWLRYGGTVTTSEVCGRRKTLSVRGYYACPLHDAPTLGESEAIL